MKLLHVSDLHLGRKAGNFQMLDDQKDILDQIVRMAEDEHADALLIAGDIYDRPVPPTDAVRAFDDFLVRLSGIKGLSVFVLSGNHDSAERIAFGGRLLDITGIHMAPVYEGKTEPVVLSDEYGKVNFYLLPFIRPSQVRRFFPEENVESCADAVSCAVSAMKIDESERNVLLSHQAVIGSVRTLSEINIGGLDSTDAGPYEIFDYTALGHIHAAQNVKGNRIRYSGAPLKYAFDECGSEKSATVVILGEKGSLETYTLPFVPKHDFITITGTFDGICEKYRDGSVCDYTEVVLKDEQDVPDAFRRLQNCFPRLIKMRYDNLRTSEKKTVTSVRSTEERSTFDIFSGLFEIMNNQPLTDEQREYIQSVIKDTEEKSI